MIKKVAEQLARWILRVEISRYEFEIANLKSGITLERNCLKHLSEASFECFFAYGREVADSLSRQKPKLIIRGTPGCKAYRSGYAVEMLPSETLTGGYVVHNETAWIALGAYWGKMPSEMLTEFTELNWRGMPVVYLSQK